MKSPVIIPAYNEETNIGRTLEALPSDLVEPFVVVNGTTDRTALVAEHYGAAVQVIPEQGKMLAVQSALEQLGSRALEPLFILDADTRPLFPRKWHDHLLKTMRVVEQPVTIGAPVLYTSHRKGEAALRTAFRAVRAVTQAKNGIDGSIQCGPNMACKILNSPLLDAIMEIPNYWPGEDRAVVNAFIEGEGLYVQSVHPYDLAVTPTSVNAVTLKERIRLDAQQTHQVVSQRYVERGPLGSIAYDPHRGK